MKIPEKEERQTKREERDKGNKQKESQKNREK